MTEEQLNKANDTLNNIEGVEFAITRWEGASVGDIDLPTDEVSIEAFTTFKENTLVCLTKKLSNLKAQFVNL
jgi:hypothetical protein